MKKEINSPKYDDIVKKAYELFWKHGIRRISIEEICTKADVSKMTFYRFFSNKTELAKVIIDRIFEANQKKYQSIMHTDVSFEAKIKKFVQMKFEGTNEISPEFVHDVHKNKKLGLTEYFQSKAAEITQEVIKDFKEAQQKGFIRQDLNILFLMAFSNKLTNMLEDQELLKLTGSTHNLVMELTNLFFYGIFPHKTDEDED